MLEQKKTTIIQSPSTNTIPVDEKLKENAYPAATKSVSHQDIPTDTTKERFAELDKDEFPEGGWGWVVVAGCFVILAASFGMVSAYGEFQKYYLTKFPDVSQSLLSLVGSLQAGSIFIFTIPAAKLIEKLGNKPSLLIATFIIVLSFMMTSLCTQVWQLALAQGILFGMGTSISVLIGFSVPSQWFKRLRATAFGIAFSGASIGGILWPIAVQRLIKQVGFGWTNRILGFLYIPMLIFATMVIRPPTEEELNKVGNIQNTVSPNDVEKGSALPTDVSPDCDQLSEGASEKNWVRRNIFHSRFLIDWTVLKDWRFDMILLANFIGDFAFYIPLFYLASFASLLNVRSGVANNILTILNSASVFGRILPGMIGDRIGRLNTFIIAVVLSGIIVLAFWLPDKGEALLVITALAFGLSSGAYGSLPPAAIGQLFGLEGMPSRMSLLLLSGTPGSLAGSAIAGVFLPTGSDSHGTEGYPKLIIFTGVLFMACGGLLIFTRCTYTLKIWKFI